MNNPRILFVGAFAGVQKMGATGGVLYACMCLLESPLKGVVDWRLLNTSLESLPPPPIWNRGWRALFRLVRFVSILCGERIDGVLLFSSAGSSLVEKGMMGLIGKAFGKRVVFCPVSGMIQNHFISRSVLARFATHVFRRVDVVVCQGQSWQEFFERETGLARAKFIIQQNWINAAPYFTLPIAPDGTDVIVLYIGWIVEYKGVFDLIEAARLCQASGNRRIMFRVVGGGASLDRARELVLRHGLSASVQILGWVEPAEKMRQLAEADIYVLPSHTEGQPYALLEAMASGRACIGTTVGGVPDLINSPGIGRLVRPHAPAELAAEIRKLAECYELRCAMGVAAREHVRQHNEILSVYPRLYHIITGYTLTVEPELLDVKAPANGPDYVSQPPT